MAVTHATTTAEPNDPAYDVSNDAWEEAHTVGDGSFVAAKLSASATDKVFGRSTAGAGNGEEIPLTAAGRALIDDANAAAQLATLGLVPGGTTTFYRADGTFATPPGAAATASENLLTGEVTMTNANQFYDGPSLSLAAGTYLFWGSVTVRITTAGVITMTARLLEGANVLDESAFTSPSGIGGGAETLHVQGMAVLGSTTTVKVSAAAATAGQVIDNTVPTNGTADKGSHLLALKIA